MTLKYHPLTEYEFLIKYLEITNIFLETSQQLTYGEMEFIAAIATLPDEKYKYQRFSMGAKKRVAQQLKITIANINNRIHALATKNYLRRDEDKVLYLPKNILLALEEFRKNNELLLTFKIPRKLDNVKE